jgi:hypothetical protein
MMCLFPDSYALPISENPFVQSLCHMGVKFIMTLGMAEEFGSIQHFTTNKVADWIGGRRKQWFSM